MFVLLRQAAKGRCSADTMNHEASRCLLLTCALCSRWTVREPQFQQSKKTRQKVTDLSSAQECYQDACSGQPTIHEKAVLGETTTPLEERQSSNSSKIVFRCSLAGRRWCLSLAYCACCGHWTRQYIRRDCPFCLCSARSVYPK